MLPPHRLLLVIPVDDEIVFTQEPSSSVNVVIHFSPTLGRVAYSIRSMVVIPRYDEDQTSLIQTAYF
jgi:hypothetical protein